MKKRARKTARRTQKKSLLKQEEEFRSRWKIAILGLILLIAFLIIIGYRADLGEKNPDFLFYLLLLGCLASIVIIIIGIIKGKNK